MKIEETGGMIITFEKARKYCIRIGCGYCFTHTPPITVCNPMLNILMKENGLEWCKKNIKNLEDYEILSDEEIEAVFGKEKKKTNLYEFSLLDLIEECN